MRISDWSSDVCSSDLESLHKAVQIRCTRGTARITELLRPGRQCKIEEAVDEVPAGKADIKRIAHLDQGQGGEMRPRGIAANHDLLYTPSICCVGHEPFGHRYAVDRKSVV